MWCWIISFWFKSPRIAKKQATHRTKLSIVIRVDHPNPNDPTTKISTKAHNNALKGHATWHEFGTNEFLPWHSAVGYHDGPNTFSSPVAHLTHLSCDKATKKSTFHQLTSFNYTILCFRKECKVAHSLRMLFSSILSHSKLVGGFNHFVKYESDWNISPSRGEKIIWNHHRPTHKISSLNCFPPRPRRCFNHDTAWAPSGLVKGRVLSPWDGSSWWKKSQTTTVWMYKTL